MARLYNGNHLSINIIHLQIIHLPFFILHSTFYIHHVGGGIRIDAHVVSKLVFLYPRIEEMDMEGEVVAVVVNVRNLKASLGRSVGEVRVRVGGRTERGAANELAEMGITDGAVNRVDTTARTENPVLVGLTSLQNLSS